MNHLQSIGESIWLAEGGLVNFYGFPYPTRSIVVRLAGGSLWIWSPVAASPALIAEVSSLGPVAHLVSPNKIHHLFLGDWQREFPNARLWGPESTVRKRRDLEFETPLASVAPPDWDTELDQFWFTGSAALDEVVFFHRASGTAILADLSENFGDAFLRAHWSPWKRAIARIWKITEPYGYPPLELRASWWRREAARETRDRLLACNPQQVVMAHGEWQRDNGREYLEKVFGWLG